MSVASKNPFSLLDAEDSSRPASPAPTPKAAAPAAPAPSANRGQQKPRTGPSRGGKYYARGGKPAPNDGAPPAAEEPVDGKKSEGGRGGRGPRGRGAPRGGKRPFDRHSATGKTDSQKKVHQGWGGDEGSAELKQEQAADADATAETAEVVPVEGDAAPVEEVKPRVEEEEDNTLTLDQYLAQKAAKDLAIPKLETRQANEGAGDDLFKDAVAISKDEEESYFVGKAKSAPKAKAKKEEKVYLEIDARFERPNTGRGRGGRGGDRGGDRGAPRGGERRGRGAPRVPRGGRQNGAAPNVDDQTAFPSLA